MSGENLPSITMQELEQRANAYADEMEERVSKDSISLQFYMSDENLRDARKSAFSEALLQHYTISSEPDPLSP
jgi:hypothetical protein